MRPITFTFNWQRGQIIGELSRRTTKRELVTATGVLNADGVADRASFIVDPNNEVQFVSVTAVSVGRNVDEV